jgi:5'-deoxynucleotidase YfbR-like HD superfamily hydrolase
MSDTSNLPFRVEDLLQMNHVFRWHTHRTHRTQNLSEHSAMVALLANSIYELVVPQHLKKDEQRYQLLWYSLIHDLPETVTSDIASPAKKELKGIFQEHGLTLDPFDILEDRLFPAIRMIKKTLNASPLKAMNKLADHLDAIAFIGLEGIGHQVAEIKARVQIDYRDKIKSLEEQFPDYHWNKALLLLEDVLKATQREG